MSNSTRKLKRKAGISNWKAQRSAWSAARATVRDEARVIYETLRMKLKAQKIIEGVK